MQRSSGMQHSASFVHRFSVQQQFQNNELKRQTVAVHPIVLPAYQSPKYRGDFHLLFSPVSLPSQLLHVSFPFLLFAFDFQKKQKQKQQPKPTTQPNKKQSTA